MKNSKKQNKKRPLSPSELNAKRLIDLQTDKQKDIEHSMAAYFDAQAINDHLGMMTAESVYVEALIRPIV